MRVTDLPRYLASTFCDKMKIYNGSATSLCNASCAAHGEDFCTY